MKNDENKLSRKKEITYLNFIWMLVISIGIASFIVWPPDNMFKAFHEPWFYLPFCGIIGTSLVFISTVDWITAALDKRYRWEEGFVKRGIYQLLWGWLFPLVLSVVFTRIYLGSLKTDILPLLYSRHMLPMVLFLSLLVNMGYAAYYIGYFFKRGLRIAEDFIPGEQYPDHLIFSEAGTELKVQVEDIAYLCSHGKHLALWFHAGAPVMLGLASLKQIATKLNPYHFLLVDRSYIIARKAYRGHKRHERGLVLILEPWPGEPVKVSEANIDFFFSMDQ